MNSFAKGHHCHNRNYGRCLNNSQSAILLTIVIKSVESAMGFVVELLVSGGVEGTEDESLCGSGNSCAEVESRFRDSNSALEEDLRNDVRENLTQT